MESNEEVQRLMKLLETSGAMKLPAPEEIANAVSRNQNNRYQELNFDRKREDPKTKKRNKIAAQSRRRNRRK